jgi:hypothetical protein
MRKTLCSFVMACLLTALPALAGPPTKDWLLYWVGADRSEVYVSVEKGYRTRGATALVSSYVEDVQGNYSMVGEVYNCATLRWSLLGQQDFDRNDRLLREYDNPNVEQSFKTAGIRDRQLIVMNTICSGSAPRSPSAVLSSVQDLAKQLGAVRSP